MSRTISLRLEQLEDRLTPSTAVPWENATHLTISFVPDGTQVAAAPNPTDPNSKTIAQKTSGAVNSNLFTDFTNAGVSASAWQGAILKAFQTWASVTNLNFSVVTPSNPDLPLGTLGVLEGDPRFADIRIAAAPLTNDTSSSSNNTASAELATAVPVSPQAGTWSGDLIFNSNLFIPANTNSTNGLGQGGTGEGSFSVNGIALGSGTSYDLYSVALHEVGHILGLQDSTDPHSVMFSYYPQTPYTGLPSGDISAIQALYGVRQPDSFENDFDADNDNDGIANNSFCTATPFRVASLQQYTAALSGLESVSSIQAVPQLSVQASLNGSQDVDYYHYTTSLFFPDFTVNLKTSNESLLEAKLTVYDMFGDVIGSATASDPQNGNLSVTVNNAWPLGVYYFKVQGATNDVFGTGAYQLQVVPNSSGPLQPFQQAETTAENNLPQNFTLATATPLSPTAQSTLGSPDYFTPVSLTSGTTRWFSVQAPNASTPAAEVTVAALDGANSLIPTVAVYDSLGNPVPTTTLAANNFTTTLQITNPTPGATYYVSVGASPNGSNTGSDFSLGVAFNVPTAPGFTPLVTGSVSATTTPLTSVIVQNGQNVQVTAYQQAFQTVMLPQSQVVNLQLSLAALPTGSPTSALEVTLFDPQGNVVFDQTLTASQTGPTTVTINGLFLAGGVQYTLRFVGGTSDGSPLPSLNYTVGIQTLNDPLGPQLLNSDSAPTREEMAELEALVANPIYGLIDPIAQQIYLEDFFILGGSA